MWNCMPSMSNILFLLIVVLIVIYGKSFVCENSIVLIENSKFQSNCLEPNIFW